MRKTRGKSKSSSRALHWDMMLLSRNDDPTSSNGLSSAQKFFGLCKVKNRDFAHIPPFPLYPAKVSQEKWRELSKGVLSEYLWRAGEPDQVLPGSLSTRFRVSSPEAISGYVSLLGSESCVSTTANLFWGFVYDGYLSSRGSRTTYFNGAVTYKVLSAQGDRVWRSIIDGNSQSELFSKILAADILTLTLIKVVRGRQVRTSK